MAKAVRRIKSFNFKRKVSALKRTNSRLPRIIAVMSKEFFRDSFRNQGFTDRSLVKWQQRKPNKKNEGRAILIKSGRLSKIQILKASWKFIKVGTLLPYGAFHNQGLGRLPKRQFIGRSRVLTTMIRREIKTEYNKVVRA